ncbi:hypothetical protein P0W64_06325 [Tsukamurella sp. 8F]|uniref:hypothetical protein n=1 Tax=unclassified Tsukamurella TaxID=2633480 RepID=UPI0023B8A602|nr:MULTISPECIES: hypothetical protein [unclassified Tsukamurella]MDF0530068.1 hypothetical protein [Tsukamurella sp. 8J]MDF0586386.1 hypothetical protein [Tsukamurella sp. 8F]
MPTATTDLQSRCRLAARQTEVLDAMLAGRVPDGFDPRGVHRSIRILHGKRASSAARAFPPLRRLPGWPEVFFAYAGEGPKRGCSAEDAREFIAWLRCHAARDQRRWIRAEEQRVGIRSGRRWWTWSSV